MQRAPLRLLVLSCFAICCAQAGPLQLHRSTPVTVISNTHEIIDTLDNRYIYRYELSDGTIRYETGYTRFINGVGVPHKEGFFIYPTPDGKTVRTSYMANQNGYNVLSYQITSERVTRAELDRLYQMLLNKAKAGPGDEKDELKNGFRFSKMKIAL